MAGKAYAFAKVDKKEDRLKVYEEIKNGKSRFGMWDQKVSLKEKIYGKNMILLRIKQGDWIVHVNMPEYGKCVAVQTLGDYNFDDGISCDGRQDFNNYFPINPESIIEFDRNDPNVLPSVNLSPRRRAQRILDLEDFLESLENLRENKYGEIKRTERGVIHLQNKVENILPEITNQIHRMNQSKEFENFLHRIFEKMPNTISVQNGFGWKTDNGADLIVEFQNPIIGINISTKVVVQAKSYENKHYDKNAIDQIAQGISEYDADAGLLITTGEETEFLEEYVIERSEQIGKNIDVIAGNDVAKFVLRYAPELLLKE